MSPKFLKVGKANGRRRFRRVDSRKFFFLVALTGRATCNITFVERPLVLGFAWWFVTGEVAPALPLALFFELFWLDLFPIGSYQPPMPAFPFLILLASSSIFMWDTPVSLAFPLALTMPLAYAVPVYESWLRGRFAKDSFRVVDMAERSEQSLGSLPAKTLVRFWLWHAGSGMLCFFAAYALLVALFSLPFFAFLHLAPGTVPLNVSWPVLYGIAAIGAVLSLRIRRAYCTFGICMCALLVFRFI